MPLTLQLPEAVSNTYGDSPGRFGNNHGPHRGRMALHGAGRVGRIRKITQGLERHPAGAPLLGRQRAGDVNATERVSLFFGGIQLGAAQFLAFFGFPVAHSKKPRGVFFVVQ